MTSRRYEYKVLELREKLLGGKMSGDAARTDPPLHLGGRDRLELPAVAGVLVQDPLELVARHLAADEPFSELQHLVLDPLSHPAMIPPRIRGGVTPFA